MHEKDKKFIEISNKLIELTYLIKDLQILCMTNSSDESKEIKT